MLKFYKIDESGYPITGSGKTIPEGFTEFTVEVAEDGLITYTPQELQDAMVALKAKEDTDNQILEAKAYLANTDYKMLPNYVPKPDEDLVAIIAKRNETREFIRNYNAKIW